MTKAATLAFHFWTTSNFAISSDWREVGTTEFNCVVQ